VNHYLTCFIITGVSVSKWAGKYVIGLTGNIGTGKSVVRRMLEHMGAYGIDADALSHRAMSKGSPGYQPVIEAFGRWILSADGEIDRVKLGRVVFSDPQGLAQLEAIIHPLVLQGMNWLIKRASQPVIVVEAIKLLEGSLAKTCDSVWVTYAPPEIQLNRLIRNRKMPEGEARQRIASQPSQEEKLAQADVVIRNDNSFELAWKQVSDAWNKTIPAFALEEPSSPASRSPALRLPQGEISVSRSKPRDSEMLAHFINRVRRNDQALTRDDIMAAFGEKAFIMLRIGSEMAGVLGWQVENLVSRTLDIHLLPEIAPTEILPALIEEMERSSRNLQCEASLVFAPPSVADAAFWQKLGYETRVPQSLGVSAWQEAAIESMRPGTTLLFKQLRVDRVLRPI
jgi:dephospho-CoA kinase